jgi:hypothetical protein
MPALLSLNEQAGRRAALSEGSPHMLESVARPSGGGAVVTTAAVAAAGAVPVADETSGAPGSPAHTAAGRRRRRTRWLGAAGLGLLGLGTSLLGRLPAAAALPVLVIAITILDVVASVVAKSWALGNSLWVLVTGCSLYVIVFWIYGISLRFGNLSTVTIAWVVLITVSDMALDRFYYGVHLPASRWLAAAAAVALLVYMLAPTDDPPS